MESMLDRFLKYVKVDTQSKEDVEAFPSTPGQLELAKIVAEDFRSVGVNDVQINENGYLLATIEGNRPAPTIGFISHFDTSYQSPGADVKPQVIPNYSGGNVNLPGGPGLAIEEARELKKCRGHTIITSDGTTLLGGDDKAGVAIMVELAKKLVENPDMPHGRVRLGIMPDEEVGIGASKFDIKGFGADYAYTMDGGALGEIDIESFSADKGKITVEGATAFPGYAKGKMVDAVKILTKILSQIPENMRPENVAGRTGFIYVMDVNGSTSKAEATFLLRDFEVEGLKKKAALLESLIEKARKKYPKAKIGMETKEQYRNMKYKLEENPRVIEYAEEAMKRARVKPRRNFVRGGTDGCHLSYSGLLTPNLFVGMQDMHSLKEWISLNIMEKAVKVCVKLLEVWVEKAQNSNNQATITK